jgi:hypothetical protein
VDLRLQPVLVATGENGDARLVWRDQELVAVLVRLSDTHEQLAGRWFLEKGFGPLDAPEPPTFADLDAALAWMRNRLRDAAAGPGWPLWRP